MLAHREGGSSSNGPAGHPAMCSQGVSNVPLAQSVEKVLLSEARAGHSVLDASRLTEGPKLRRVPCSVCFLLPSQGAGARPVRSRNPLLPGSTHTQPSDSIQIWPCHPLSIRHSPQPVLRTQFGATSPETSSASSGPCPPGVPGIWSRLAQSRYVIISADLKTPRKTLPPHSRSELGGHSASLGPNIDSGATWAAGRRGWGWG